MLAFHPLQVPNPYTVERRSGDRDLKSIRKCEPCRSCRRRHHEILKWDVDGNRQRVREFPERFLEGVGDASLGWENRIEVVVPKTCAPHIRELGVKSAGAVWESGARDTPHLDEEAGQ